MARRQKDKVARFPDLVLRVSYSGPEHGGYFHIRGRIENREGRTLYGHEEGGKFRGVTFNGQTDYESLARVKAHHPETPMYGHEVEWEAHHHYNLACMKAGAVALGEIERKMEAIEKEAGRPASFGAWVQRIAVAVGVGGIKLPDKEWAVDPEAGGRQIDYQIAEWEQKARERMGVKTA